MSKHGSKYGRKHGLSAEHLSIIRQILKPYANAIDSVGLFGSRAQGTYRENSDIDMVLYGRLREADIDRIYSLFEESFLPVKVDVNAYHLIEYPPLKAHVDAAISVLFTHEDLRGSGA